MGYNKRGKENQGGRGNNGREGEKKEERKGGGREGREAPLPADIVDNHHHGTIVPVLFTLWEG